MTKTPLLKPTYCLMLALALAACAQSEGGVGSVASTAVVDSSGRVTRPRGERNLDDSTGRAVLGALKQSDPAGFKGVSVLAWDGSVLLAGAVAKPEMKRRAETLARGVNGVRTVHNELVMDENPAHPNYVADVALEQRLYAALLGNGAISGAYVLRVVNGVATLMGSATTQADVDRAMNLIREADGVKWAVNRVSLVPPGK